MGYKVSPLPHQEEVLGKLKSGSVLHGTVGSGKTLTSLFYYLERHSDKKLYVITTAKKRDDKDWEEEAALVGITDIVIDSWNNIKKYSHIHGAFFIFDEQRAVGYQTWAKNFISICLKNHWLMLTATPGDVWMDYVPLFIANGFYRNKTDFVNQHVEYDRFVKYPKVKRYHNEGRLIRLRQQILVPMASPRKTKRIRKIAYSKYDVEKYKTVSEKRWNVFTDLPIGNASEHVQVLRKIVATDPSRLFHARWVIDVHEKLIVFYNYNYELDILKALCEELNKPYAQWNGHKHDKLPETDEWAYLVQYTAGAEGWNCIETNVMLFYSFNYSYKVMEQAEGRIDRLNTPFDTLEYFYLSSEAPIDRAVRRAIKKKKKFNESAWLKGDGLYFRKQVSDGTDQGDQIAFPWVNSTKERP